MKKIHASIIVDPEVTPVFCKPRTLPFAMIPLVDEALDKLIDQQVIEPVTYSDWAAPIVPLLKKHKKTLHLCGDFSVTVNRAAKLDSYPIPRIDDLFTKLTGGKSFSKLDLSQAYLQVELDEESTLIVDSSSIIPGGSVRAFSRAVCNRAIVRDFTHKMRQISRPRNYTRNTRKNGIAREIAISS